MKVVLNPTNGGTINELSRVYTHIEDNNSQDLIDNNSQYITTQQETITIQAVASYGFAFKNITINGEEVSNVDTYTYFDIDDETEIVVNFDRTIFYVYVTTNPVMIGGVDVTPSQVPVGTSVTIRAREFGNYTFSSWSNGTTTNPLVINNVQSDIFITANYVSSLPVGNYNFWRGYVKDALNLTDPPKASLTILSHTIREDLMTTANSEFECLEIPDNINNGDVIIVANPYGIFRYFGVVKSIEETTIQTYQMQHFFSGQQVYAPQNSGSYLEGNIRDFIWYYQQGWIFGASSYRDPLIQQLMNGITLTYTNSISGKLETKDKKTTIDVEQFIYDVYKNYNIMVEFNVAFSGQNIANIGLSTAQKKKIGNNTNAVYNMSPITQVEETNKLVIFDKDGNSYRNTYIAKADGTIVSEPSQIADRFMVTKTKIVYSDDPLADLIAANLPSEMLNHKLTFTMRLDNNLYSFDDLPLGTSVDIWIDGQYFSSVITGRSYSKPHNQEVTEINYTCGKVRTALSEKLSLKLGII